MKKFDKIKKYATIDIGSNAIRLLISNIIVLNKSAPISTKNSLVRVPIRLGQDAFTIGEISNENIERLVDTMLSFKLLMKVHKVEKYLAYATSALRSSSNGKNIVDLILSKSGLKIQIINGKKEAELITNNSIFKFQENYKTYCFIDVGGGSTELTLFKNQKVVISKSFKIGGVRLINNLVSNKTWESFREWININLKDQGKIDVIGLGGNINKLFKLCGVKIGKPLTLKEIDSTLSDLEKMSYSKKILLLKLNPDRIDVIVPAGKIYQYLLKNMGSDEIIVPKIGLADGMVYELLKSL
ncbi:MAG: exopolyphosphatase [Flavobacteriaceae bacterium]|nr:exopolyphosphatase [Flavobacteriaceae bacterium]MBT5395620.1 exopolyphosphatase [Flavobacteriaceae bacterium]MBT6688255.1 exopolyphosphatase [Flavobacteriaceae bacterium]